MARNVYQAWEASLVDVGVEFILRAHEFRGKSSSQNRPKPMENESHALLKKHLPDFIYNEMRVLAKSFLASVSPSDLQRGPKERDLYRSFIVTHADTLHDMYTRWKEMQTNDAYQKDMDRMHIAVQPHLGGRPAEFADNAIRRERYIYSKHPETVEKGVAQNHRLQQQRNNFTLDVRKREFQRLQNMRTWLPGGDYMDTQTMRNTSDPFMAQRQTFLSQRSIPFV
jgi:hypothetical protein